MRTSLISQCVLLCGSHARLQVTRQGFDSPSRVCIMCVSSTLPHPSAPEAWGIGPLGSI